MTFARDVCASRGGKEWGLEEVKLWKTVEEGGGGSKILITLMIPNLMFGVTAFDHLSCS